MEIILQGQLRIRKDLYLAEFGSIAGAVGGGSHGSAGLLIASAICPLITLKISVSDWL